MKNKIYITISVLIFLILSILALNTISTANYEFLNSKYKKFISINFENEKINIQVADKLFVFKNIFVQK